MYTPFYGKDFLIEYIKNRREMIVYFKKSLTNIGLVNSNKEVKSDTYIELSGIYNRVVNNSLETVEKDIEVYIRRFEVAKRLRNQYPVINTNDIASINTHILFFELLVETVARIYDVRYVNVMLKVSDTLLSVKGLIVSKGNIERLLSCLVSEVEIVRALASKMSVNI
jgi:hypothetical protein